MEEIEEIKLIIEGTDKKLNIKRYLDFDTDDSVKIRIACRLGTLPDIIKIDKKKVSSLELDIKSLDNIINNIKNYTETLSDKYKINKSDFILYLILFHPDFKTPKVNKDVKDFKVHFIDSELKGFGYELEANDTFNKYIRKIFDIKNKDIRFNYVYDKDFKIFHRNYYDNLNRICESANIKYIEELLKYEPQKSTDFLKTHVITEMTFDSEYDIYELFNNANLNIYVPFINLNNTFSKILKQFEPSKKWIDLISEDEIKQRDITHEHINSIICYTINTNEILDEYSNMKNEKEYLSYSKVNIIQKEEKKKDIFQTKYTYVLSFESSLNEEYTDEKIINNVLDIFRKNEEGKEEEKNVILNQSPATSSKVKGTFYIDDIYLYEVILRDMCMNNEIMSNFLSINESLQLVRKKENIYVYFTIGNQSLVSASLNSNIVKNKDHYLKSNGFKVGNTYMFVNITKAENEKEAIKFKNIFAKLMTLYKDKIKEVSKIYSKCISDFKEEYMTISEKLEKIEKESKSEPRLKDLLPNLFTHGYLSLCQQPHPPVLITDANRHKFYEKKSGEEQLKRIYSEKGRVFTYPHFNEVKNPHEFVCTDEKGGGKYVNWIMNEEALRNKALIPYFPCCVNDQNKSNFGKTLDKLYESESTEITRAIITTDKIITNSGQHGKLPENINKILNTISIGQVFAWHRIGVKKSPSSILYALSSIFKEEKTINEKYILKKRTEIKNRIGDKFSSYQFTYNLDKSELEKLLDDSDVYLDPELFINELEEMYKCHILLFTNNEKNSSGYLSAPHFTQYYYNYVKKSSRPVVLIYIHKALKAKQKILAFPHCEYIGAIYNENDKSPTIIFERDNKNYKEIINRLLYIFHLTYVHNGYDKIKLPSSFKIVSQKVDFFGKTRRIDVKMGNKIISIYTNPLPNLKVPINNDSEGEISFSNKVIDKFLTEHKLNKIYEDEVIVKSRYENVDFVIYKKREMKKENILAIYNHYQRNARYLLEYFYYTFSIFLEKEEKREIDIYSSDFLLNFKKQMIKIDPTITYLEMIQRKFEYNYPLLYTEGKLRISDENLFNKMIYNLKLKSKSSIRKYKDLKYIVNYYQDITDFRNIETQTILYGSEALYKWIKEKYIKYDIIDVIPIISDDLVNSIVNKKTKNEKERKKKEKKEGKKNIEEDEETLFELKVKTINNLHLSSFPFIFSNKIMNYLLYNKIENSIDSSIDRTFILQPVSSIAKGKTVYKSWKNNNINNAHIIEQKQDDENDDPYILLAYNSPTDIIKRIVTEDDEIENDIPIILQYCKIISGEMIFLTFVCLEL